MNYIHWLLGLSLLFVAAERVWPWRKQSLFRKGLLWDGLYLIFNAQYSGALLGVAAAYLLRIYNPRPLIDFALMGGQPLWLQFVISFLAIDLIKYGIHNLLHRVPFLWEFHKVHHSVLDMDWIGNWRFHWVETIVYDGLLYVPAAILGFAPEALFWNGVVATFFGHYAHANVRIGPGVLRFVINSPQMHIWHHTHPSSGPVNRNFGIALSVWDWIFSTAYMPAGKQPKELGFQGIEEYPGSLPGQWVAPFQGARK